MNRRGFLLSSGLFLGTMAIPGFVRRALAQQQPGAGVAAATLRPAGKKTLVLIFQRGAADGLAMVPPIGDPHYRAYRPNIALAAGGDGAAPSLDGFFHLHPALGGIKDLFDAGTAAVIHEAGNPGATRSHFDAQDFMESGTPGVKTTEDGFLNRSLSYLPGGDSTGSTFRAVAMQPILPRALRGSKQVLAMNSIRDFAEGGALKNVALASDFESMYAGAVDQVLHGVGDETFRAMGDLKQVLQRVDRLDHAQYPKGPLGSHLAEIAKLIKADVGLQLAMTDCGGWDTHIDEGGAQGSLARNLRGFGDAIAAFAKDLGPRLSDVCLVTMTEFGRTVRENGNGGTDHGHGSVMFVVGGGVRGKRVLARWKGLDESNLFEGRDLPITTDYRDVMLEALRGHLGLRLTPAATAAIFPEYKVSAGNAPSLFRG